MGGGVADWFTALVSAPRNRPVFWVKLATTSHDAYSKQSLPMTTRVRMTRGSNNWISVLISHRPTLSSPTRLLVSCLLPRHPASILPTSLLTYTHIQIEVPSSRKPFPQEVKWEIYILTQNDNVNEDFKDISSFMNEDTCTRQCPFSFSDRI